jgi:PAS domain S-box-containing protein
MDKDKRPLDILIIEDNIGDFILIDDFIDEHFLQAKLTHVRNFRQARAAFAHRSRAFDVVMLDLTLPDAAGERMVYEAMNLAGTAPLVLLTGYTDIPFSIRSLSAGVSDYLLKDELSPTILYKSLVYNIERKSFINQLKESEQRYRDLFHLSPQPMWVFDEDTLRFLDVNQAAISNYGYTAAEFMDMTILDIRPDEDSDTPDICLSEEILWPEYTPPENYRHQKKNGEIIYVEVQVSLLDDENSNTRLVLASDVTERYHYTRAIETQNKKLRDIAWVQSHVVRAPLSRLMGIVQMIEESAGLSEADRELLDYLRLTADEMDKVVRDITEKAEQIDFNNVKKEMSTY